jgi:enamine deaminase RidA (YjgF/YER057c/UK114 family)
MRNVVGRPPFAWAEGLQYSQAVTFGDDGEVVEGGFEAQLRRTFANVDAALGSLGASLATIAKLTVYLVDKGDYETFKRVRAELLTAPWPASTAVVVRELLVDGMLVEIDAVAVVGSSRLER